jgi:hypothetical protein
MLPAQFCSKIDQVPNVKSTIDHWLIRIYFEHQPLFDSLPSIGYNQQLAARKNRQF